MSFKYSNRYNNFVVVHTLRKAPVPIQIQKLSLRGSDSTWVGDSQGSHYNDNPFYFFKEINHFQD